MKTMTVRLIGLCWLCCVVHPQIAAAQGRVIVQHRGLNDPESEGFTLRTSGSPRFGPVTDDLGVEAWSIAADGVDIAFYKVRISPEETERMVSQGWVLALDLRVMPPFASPTVGPDVTLVVGGAPFLLEFGAQADGNPIVRFQGEKYPLRSLGIEGTGYHRYVLSYEPADGMTTLLVDDVRVTSVRKPVLDPLYGGSLSWGTEQHPWASSAAHWHEVTLTVVPEPSAWTLFGLGLGLVAFRRRGRPGAGKAQAPRSGGFRSGCGRRIGQVGIKGFVKNTQE